MVPSRLVWASMQIEWKLRFVYWAQYSGKFAHRLWSMRSRTLFSIDALYSLSPTIWSDYEHYTSWYCKVPSLIKTRSSEMLEWSGTPCCYSLYSVSAIDLSHLSDQINSHWTAETANLLRDFGAEKSFGYFLFLQKVRAQCFWAHSRPLEDLLLLVVVLHLQENSTACWCGKVHGEVASARKVC